MLHSRSFEPGLVQVPVQLEDHDGWQEFFDTYWRLIYDVALKAGLNEAEAEEVVQETLTSVAKAIAGSSARSRASRSQCSPSISPG